MAALDLTLLLGSAALLVWGGLYVGQFSGRFDPNEFSETPHGPAPKVLAVAADPNAKMMAIGARVYVNCAQCHQADGAGDASKDVPPLAGSDWVLAGGPDRIIRIVVAGLGGPLTVKGQAYGKNNMFAWLKSPDNPSGLSPDEIAAVVSYVRNSWGNKASMVTADQVNAVLADMNKEHHSGPWTADDLMKRSMGGGATAGPITADQIRAALKAMPADQMQALLKEVKP